MPGAAQASVSCRTGLAGPPSGKPCRPTSTPGIWRVQPQQSPPPRCTAALRPPLHQRSRRLRSVACALSQNPGCATPTAGLSCACAAAASCPHGHGPTPTQGPRSTAHASAGLACRRWLWTSSSHHRRRQATRQRRLTQPGQQRDQHSSLRGPAPGPAPSPALRAAAPRCKAQLLRQQRNAPHRTARRTCRRGRARGACGTALSAQNLTCLGRRCAPLPARRRTLCVQGCAAWG